MQRHICIVRGGWLGGLALVLLSAAIARADGPPPPPQVHVGPMGVEVAAQPHRVSDYWIGLLCGPLPDLLRAHLKLPEDQGLLVENVLPNSPGAKAGVKQYDVLLKAGGKPLGKITDLIDAVDAAKDEKFALELYRGGKSTKIDVTPLRRPKEMQPPDDMPGPGDRDLLGKLLEGLRQVDPETAKRLTEQAKAHQEEFREWLERIRPGAEGQPPMRFRFFHPGAILPPDGPAPPLPGNMTVAITKQGDNPAKIKVTRNGDKWEVTEDELDKLPEDVRPHIERMLGQAPHLPGPRAQSFDFDFVPDLQRRDKPSGDGPLTARPENRLDNRLEQMQRQLDEMRKSIDELLKNRPRLRDPEQKQKKV